jgi:glyoxylase-like metal-dependent hydrolase (beta-lactamase superfamily II)
VKGISMKSTIVQRPVGQGGLLQGSLDCGATPLRWMYDCGSNQIDSLYREISRVAANPSLDILFLSHLDSDHVSGIDRLLTMVSVSEVVLPYLREADISLAVCRDVEAGRLTGLFLDFAADPAGWLIGRGVVTVTFVEGRGDDGPDDDGPDGTPETGGGGE